MKVAEKIDLSKESLLHLESCMGRFRFAGEKQSKKILGEKLSKFKRKRD